jgi:hypothetical protein
MKEDFILDKEINKDNKDINQEKGINLFLKKVSIKANFLKIKNMDLEYSLLLKAMFTKGNGIKDVNKATVNYLMHNQVKFIKGNLNMGNLMDMELLKILKLKFIKEHFYEI